MVMMADTLFVILCIAVVSPIVVYLCVKFGTVAFYKAKQFIEKELKKKEKS